MKEKSGTSPGLIYLFFYLFVCICDLHFIIRHAPPSGVQFTETHCGQTNSQIDVQTKGRKIDDTPEAMLMRCLHEIHQTRIFIIFQNLAKLVEVGILFPWFTWQIEHKATFWMVHCTEFDTPTNMKSLVKFVLLVMKSGKDWSQILHSSRCLLLLHLMFSSFSFCDQVLTCLLPKRKSNLEGCVQLQVFLI